MFLLVGLGNPGLEYARTRHNVGFWVIDELAARNEARLTKVKCQSYYQRLILKGKRVILAKPLTYMNRSGLAVSGLLRYFSLNPEQLLIIYDDLDLPSGRIRLRPGGGSGGHKGMASIIAWLGMENFPRLRLGIGRDKDDENFDAARYVLTPLSCEEERRMQKTICMAADAVEVFVGKGLEEAMNTYNVLQD